MVQGVATATLGVCRSVDECYQHAPTLIKGQVLPAPVGSGHTSEISVSSTSRAAGSKPILVIDLENLSASLSDRNSDLLAINP
jgi:hypothetical protein